MLPSASYASVRARLQANAKETRRPFQEVLQYFAMERFLFRLSVSPHAKRLVLKGGLMLTAWRAPSSRPTKDISKIRQGTGFLRKSRIEVAPATLQEVVDEISGFIGPVARAISLAEPFTSRWTAPGPWA
jgi:hypothetical protein